MIYAQNTKSGRKITLALGLCLCLMMTMAVFMAFLPANAQASNIHEGELIVKQVNKEVPVKSSKGDLSVNDPEFEWNYALYTLIIRFVGIFIVLGIIQVVIQVSGRVFMSIEKKKVDAATK